MKTFSGDLAFLSNFYPAEVTFAGSVFPSVEHAYQAAKSTDPAFVARVQLVSASGAKRLGRSAVLRNGWDTLKIPIMEFLIARKFSDPVLAGKLLATGDTPLAEGNTWHDNFWGACSCQRCSNKEKHNHLGKILMAERQRLREKLEGM